ncbi:MAG TPA: YkgJ family cysteine cluster protein [Anaeromyxobacter sp.]|nr:YkgJ family cysteine cluster protein [Anaeromyxobacter sp.]
MGAPTASPCGTCDARCCSAYAVHVTGDDVRRLADGTGIPPHAFLWCQPQAARTATGFLLEPGGPSYDLVLAPPRSAEVRPPCAFLSAGDGPPRCGAYRFRPRVCRRFPAVRREGGYGVRDGIVCPPGAWDGRDMARLSWRVALEREEREAHAYAAVVTVWNARVARAGAATFPRYLDWLTDAYGWLVRWRAALRPAERAGAAYLERIRRTLASCPAR